MKQKQALRLNRHFDRLQRKLPFSARFLEWVRMPSARLVRLPLGALLVVGGLLSFLPVLGIWMLPLGLLLLALDLPILQGPINVLILRLQRRWTTWRRQRRDRRA